MKQQILKSLMAMLAALFSLNTSAYDAYIDGIYYNFDASNNTATVTHSYDYMSHDINHKSNYSGAVTIPATVTYNKQTYDVTSIGNDAFWYSSGLTSVTIPNSITSIGVSAFQGCSGLTSVIIPNSITYIDKFIFWECSGLTSVTIPVSVTYIGEGAFCLCSGLTSVTIPNSVTYIGKSAFSGCTGLKAVTIPNSVTFIGESAFAQCSLSSVDIPKSVVSIGESAFYGCNGLTSVDIPNSVTSIGRETFRFCGGLSSVTIPNSVTSIGEYAFIGCSSLISVVSEIETPFVFGASAFSNIGSTCTLAIPYGTYDAYIAKGWTEKIFKGGIVEAAPPSPNITFANDKAKTICVARWDINGDEELNEFEASVVKSIDGAFKDETEITSFDELSYFTGLTSIGESVFEGCSGLTSVSIPENITSIGASAFSGCSQLTSVALPDNITSIGANAFASETKLYVTQGSKALLALWNAQMVPYEKTTDERILPPTFAVETTQTTATVTIENWRDGYSYQYNDEETTDKEFSYMGLEPESTHDVTLIVSSDDVQYATKGSFTTQSLMPRIEKWTSTASSISATGAYTEDDAKVVASSIQVEGSEAVEGNAISCSGLNPDSEYAVTYTIEVDYGGEGTATYIYTSSIRTKAFEAIMAQPKVVSEGNVIVSATTNLDEKDSNVGFEWRSTDWTEEFPSNTGVAYPYDGTIEGCIKNLNTSKLWKCRPYYLSNSGIYYYGDWMGIDPTNTSYFEPTVHTYSNVTVEGNTALIRGYALSGTDEVEVQGFKYWRTKTRESALRKAAADIPTDAITVEVSNMQQILTTSLTNLEYDSEYCYVAFVTTKNRETFYGEAQTFVTDRIPTDIEEIENGNTADESAIELARYNMKGQQIAAPQKGVNIIRYSNGQTKKIVVK